MFSTITINLGSAHPRQNSKAKQAYGLGSKQLAAGQIDIPALLNTQAAYFQTIIALKQIRLTLF